MTLIRKSSVTGPTTLYNQAGDWTQYSTDYFTNVGTHTFNGFTPSMLSGYEDLTVNGTSQNVVGLSPNSNYYYRVRAAGLNSTSTNSNVITVNTGIAKVSAGDGDWNSITWSPAGTPVAKDEVTIDHAVTLAGTADCHNLTIGAGGSLNVASGGSIITSGTATGDVTIQRTIAGAEQWHLISSPVASQIIISDDWTLPETIGDGTVTTSMPGRNQMLQIHGSIRKKVQI
ncbi:MAG: hypothetical protein IPH20_25680 [Bacteroidales bacterium]|nr:hypothetical protein [Bacteroidales bacterium]